MYRDVASSNGLIAFKLGLARIKVGYNRMIHKVDLDEIRKNMEHIERLAYNLSTTDHLMDTFNFKLKTAHNKLKNLSVRRRRRGLINGLGKIVKFIAGNPDQDDLDLINSNLETIEKTENTLIQNQNKQVKINLGIQDTVNKISETVRKAKVQVFNNINHLNDEVELMNLILNLDILIKILENIVEQVAFAKSNLLNINILTENEKHHVYNSLLDQHIQINFESELSEFTKCIVTAKENVILIIVKTPIVDPKEYTLLQLEAIDTNGTRIDINVHYVARNRDTIYEQAKPCILYQSSHQLHDDCIFNIMTNQEAKCSTVKTQSHARISEIKPGIILVDTSTAIEVLDSCADSRLISTPTIVQTGNCTVKISNFTFSTNAEVADQPDYFTPLLGNKIVINEHKPSIEEIHHLNLKNIEEIEEVKIRLTHHKATGAVAIASFRAILLILLYIHRRRNPFKSYIISKLPQTIEEANLKTLRENGVTSLESDPGDSKHPSTEGHDTSEPKVNRGRLTAQGGDVTRGTPW